MVLYNFFSVLWIWSLDPARLGERVDWASIICHAVPAVTQIKVKLKNVIKNNRTIPLSTIKPLDGCKVHTKYGQSHRKISRQLKTIESSNLLRMIQFDTCFMKTHWSLFEVLESRAGVCWFFLRVVFFFFIPCFQLGPILRIKNCSFKKFAVSVKTDNFEGYFSQQKLMFLQIIYQFFPKKILSL